jgi:hypothetical protein
MTSPKVLLVGNASPTHVGAHLLEAARQLGLEMRVCDMREAYRGPFVPRKIAWWLGGHRPLRLGEFSRDVVEAVRTWRPDVVLTTGIAPLTERALGHIGRAGAKRLNFSTDDPWNPAHRAPWFLRALPAYDIVFSPRSANLDDLRRAGVPRVEYVPFGYSPGTHRPDAGLTAEERERFDADVMLAGGADAERVELVTPLIQAGFSVALYGGYWTRFAATRRHGRGVLDERELRKATAAARVCLGLVRRANRDGHSMRTFEVPAMRGCFLPERTADHVSLFGPEGETVLYFDNRTDLVGKVRRLLADAGERERIAARAHDVVTRGGHTYADRLAAMLAAA